MATAKKVRDLMSTELVKASGASTVAHAAHQMRAENVGTVIVEDEGKVRGIVTDRDIVVRAVAEGRPPESTYLSDICSPAVTALSPDADLDQAIALMRENAIRRLVIEDPSGGAVGILSLGDLAVERDPKSALGQISAAPPTQ
jgi:CBS domain-containing protein